MLDPSAIITQARQGLAPASWQVYVGKRPGPLALGCCFAFFAAFFLAFCGIATTIAGAVFTSLQFGPSLSQGGQPSLGGDIPLSQIGLIVAGVGATVILTAGIFGVARGNRNKRMPAPLLVVMPEGFVEYANDRKPILAFAFADLAQVNLRIHTTTTTSYNVAGDPTSGSRTTRSTSTWLDLLYRDGRRARWSPRAGFGRRDAILQSIIAAHARAGAAINPS